MFKPLLLISISILLLQKGIAQIASPGTPTSKHVSLSKAPTVILPAIPLQQLLAEDELDKKTGQPPRFGHKTSADYKLSNSGLWSSVPGGRVWRLRVIGRGARSIHFLFDEFRLPPGATLFLYNDDYSYVAGAFTQANEQPDGKFATAPVKGEAVTLELFEPSRYQNKSRLHIAQSVYAYRDLFDLADRVTRDFGDSGPCNIDVECRKTGWEDQVSSVGIILVGGNRTCTGAVINNTLNDGTPYFLTANHCMGGSSPGSLLSSWVFVFNYESPTCNGPDGSLQQGVTGGVVRALFPDSDLALIEMSNPPPVAYNVFYSGWDRRDIPADSSVAIHHPSNDVKKISFNNDVNVSSPGLSGVTDSHWRVTEWEDGTTEGGSSGSPLFNQKKRIVGQLHGGTASCASNTEDEYGKVFTSWTGGGNSSSRLSDWLDPAQTGAQFIDGTTAFSVPPWEIGLQEARGVNDSECDTLINASLLVRNLGANPVSKITVDYQFDADPVKQFIWTGPAINKRQVVEINLPPELLNTGAHTFTATISAPNDSMDAVSANNEVNTSFNAAKGNLLTVRLITDEFPDETVIAVRDQVTYALIAREDNFRSTSENRIEFCLPDGCYAVVITDSNGDGLLGRFTNGYVLIEENGSVIDSIGPDFRDSTFRDVCLPLPLKAEFATGNQFCEYQKITPRNTSTGAVQYEWLAPGATPSSSSLRKPSFSYNAAGNYTLTLIVESKDGSRDTTDQQVQIQNGNHLRISVTTDAFPEETSYRLFDESWQEIGSRLQYSGMSRTVADDYCLPSGCYAMVIYDSSADGMCCNYGQGGYQVLGRGGNIIGSGGQFGASDTVKFCLRGVGVDPVFGQDQFKLFPNPANDLVTLTSEQAVEGLQVFDATGRKVLNTSPQTKRFSFETKTWPIGVYIVRISTQKGVATKRLIVR